MKTQDGINIKNGDSKMAKYMLKKEVKIELLQELLEKHYDVEVDKKENEIFLKDLHVSLYILERISLIRLHALMLPNETVSTEEIITYANKCNMNLILGKVSVEEFYDENSKKCRHISLEYDIDYYCGVSPASIIRAIKQFYNIIGMVIEQGNIFPRYDKK